MKTIKRALYITLLLIIGWMLWSFLSHKMPWKKAPETRHQLRVMTYNTQGMAINKGMATKMAMLRYINAQDADIVCLQEVLVYKNEKFFAWSSLLWANTLKHILRNIFSISSSEFCVRIFVNFIRL